MGLALPGAIGGHGEVFVRKHHPLQPASIRFAASSNRVSSVMTAGASEDWRNRLLQGGRYPYIDVDGIYLRRIENTAIWVAIAVNADGSHAV